jgi:lipoate-protein ligase B
MTSSTRIPLAACALGALPYREGLRLQESLVAARAAARDRGIDSARDRGAGAGTEAQGLDASDWLLFPDHPPVLTVGRSPSAGNVRVPRSRLDELGIEVFEVARGGDITWHGPGQLVCYTICDLDARGRDLHRFLRELEEALIRTLASYGIPGERVAGRTGVWVEGAKIASIGIAVRRWVSYHGIALNVRPDLGFFDLIHPCGLSGIRMTSLSSLLGSSAPTLDGVRVRTAEEMAENLGYDPPHWASPADAWRTASSGRPEAAGVTAAVHSSEPRPARETGTEAA